MSSYPRDSSICAKECVDERLDYTRYRRQAVFEHCLLWIQKFAAKLRVDYHENYRPLLTLYIFIGVYSFWQHMLVKMYLVLSYNLIVKRFVNGYCACCLRFPFIRSMRRVQYIILVICYAKTLLFFFFFFDSSNFVQILFPRTPTLCIFEYDLCKTCLHFK